MVDTVKIILDLLSQFTGGRGGIDNIIVNYVIAAIFYAVLFKIALTKYTENQQSREYLLLWGFGFGLIRELFMITMAVVNALRLINPVTLHSIFPPLEHALLHIAMIIIAGAYLHYFINRPALTRRYLQAGITATVLAYLATFWWWIEFIEANPTSRFGKVWCDWLFHGNVSFWLFLAIIYLFNKARCQTFKAVVLALCLFAISEFLKLPDMAVNETYENVFTPIARTCYLFGIALLGYVYIEERNIERVRTELSLKRESEKNLALLHNASDGIHILDFDGNIIEVSDSFCAMLGYRREEMIGMNVSQWDANFSYSECIRLVRLQFTNHNRTQFETLHRRKDGTMLDVEVSGFSLVLDGKQVLFNSSRDITERKQAATMQQEALDRLHKIARQLPGVVFQFRLRTDGSSSLPYASDVLFDIYRVTPEEVRDDATKLFAVVHPDDLDEHLDSIHSSARNLSPWRNEYRLRFADSTEIWLFGNALPHLEEDGSVLWHGFVSDITERKRIEADLYQKEGYQRALIDNFPFMVWLKDTASNYLAVNKVFAQAFGESDPDRIIGKNDFDYSSKELAESYRRDDQSVLVSNERKIVEEEYIDHLGEHRWVETFKAPVVDDKGVMLGTVGFAQDISDRKKSEIDTRIAATAFEAQEGMTVTDAEGTILRVNQAFTNITGYTDEEAIGKNPRVLKSDRHNSNFYETMWESINNTGAWTGEIWNQRKNGEVYPEHLSITAVKNTEGITTNYVATFTDITLVKEAENEIKQLAFYDPLTGLPNRRLLQERLKPALASSHHSSRKGALLFIDLDNFKILNDTQGHDMGDLLLQQVAQRLESCVREGDTVARLGGDEFVVMLEDLSEQAMEAAAQTEVIANKILIALNAPYQLAAHEYHSTPSIGATLFIGHEQSIDDLLKQADIAMYQAKDSGRNTLRFFDPQMQATINARVKLESELQLALLENHFLLYYQPQVCHNQQVIGAEVLIRWQHPLRGLISPADFIPLAEETYLIIPIGQWVLEMACVQIKIWEENEHTQDLQLAVNVSAHQFHQADFVDRVSEVLKRSAINPARLKLELTESLVLKNIDDTISKMYRLKKIGVHFSMDDFGTGYSSLSSLKKLPFDQLKIDQSFIRDITSDPDDAVIVQTIIAMANKLGMEVIAEGVETEAQRDFLEQNNCPLYQGYLFSKPVPIEQFDVLVLK